MILILIVSVSSFIGYLKSASTYRVVQKLKSFTMELYSLVAESGRIKRSFDEGNIQ